MAVDRWRLLRHDAATGAENMAVDEAIARAIAGGLVTSLAIAPAIATVLAAIAVKLFFRAAHGAMCDVWKTKLPQTSGS